MRQPLGILFAVLLSLTQTQALATSSAPQKQNSVPGISQIDYEFSASAILCDRHRIILNQDGSSALFTQLCRNRRPGDRATYCQVKRGTVTKSDFQKLGRLLEQGRFFEFKSQYYLDPNGEFTTEGSFESTRVIRSRETYEVVSYNGNGPSALWAMLRAIEGVSALSEWKKVYEQPTCPAWQKGPLAP